MKMSSIAVSVQNLTKMFGDFKAVSDVTFDVESFALKKIPGSHAYAHRSFHTSKYSSMAH